MTDRPSDKLVIDDRSPTPLDPAPLRRLAALVLLDELGLEPEVSLVLCDDATIAELNWKYLAHEGPTDVISFPQHDLTPGTPHSLGEADPFGDIVISVETAARQAAEFAGWEPTDEIALLLVHGLLHLCGYDDQDPTAQQAMRAREDELLAAAGLGPVPRDEP